MPEYTHIPRWQSRAEIHAGYCCEMGIPNTWIDKINVFGRRENAFLIIDAFLEKADLETRIVDAHGEEIINGANVSGLLGENRTIIQYRSK